MTRAETFTVLHGDTVLASGLSERDAARLILTHGGLRYDVASYRDPRVRQRLYVLRVTDPGGNGALSSRVALASPRGEVVATPFAYAHNRAEGEAAIFRKVLNHSFQWLGYPEAIPDEVMAQEFAE